MCSIDAHGKWPSSVSPFLSADRNSHLTHTLMLSVRCFSSKTGLRPSGLKLSVGQRVLKFLKGYDAFLAKFPTIYRVFRIFSIGTKDLYLDVSDYLRVSKELSLGKNVNSLTYNEIMKLFTVPKALARVTPTLLISALPFANYIVFPLAYKYPKVFLSTHYWTLEQRVDFALEDHTKKLMYFKPVFRHLQNNLKSIEDEEIREKTKSIFYILGSGMHPPLDRLLLVSSIFRSRPYELTYLTSSHLSDLCHMHGLRASVLFSRSSRLAKHANLLGEMDDAIMRDGGPSTLSMADLKSTCFLRGLNPINMNTNDLSSWLESWLSLSCGLHKEARISMLLHAPVFLAYNQPSNWRLIY